MSGQRRSRSRSRTASEPAGGDATPADSTSTLEREQPGAGLAPAPDRINAFTGEDPVPLGDAAAGEPVEDDADSAE